MQETEHWSDPIKTRFEYVGRQSEAGSRLYRDRTNGKLCTLKIDPETGDLVPQDFEGEYLEKKRSAK